MANSIVPQAIGSLVTDILAALGVPGANTGGLVVGQAIDRLFSRRREMACEILLDELRQGAKTIHDVAEVEETVAITYRYLRAAHEGAARLNLRLMAKIIAGQAQLGNLVADEFLYYADMLATLRREEVILLAALFRNMNERKARSPNEPEKPERAYQELENALIPNVFCSRDDMFASAASAMRTGLLRLAPESFYQSDYPRPSPLLARIMQLASFEDALSQESTEKA
ncbi:MAG: hypothetical protein H6842_10250 [Rhodospirillaceae bacterium]|nr:hypothetical protein [Rhodospirillaceae bacterium]